MDGIWFEKASQLDRDALFDYVSEFSHAEETKYLDTVGVDDIDSFVHSLELAEDGRGLKPGYVRQETFFVLGVGRRILGRIDYRDQLNESLAIEGGNISFEVRPSERNKGIGKAMLQRFLAEKFGGRSRVLVTCFEENFISEKLIRSVGGAYEDSRPSPRNGKMAKRFWIDLSGHPTLRQMTLNETATAYQLLCERVSDLIASGSKQYSAPYPPLDGYLARTIASQNWLLEKRGEILGIVSLIDGGIGTEWADFDYPHNHLWVSSLFVAKKSKNQGFGKVILDHCRTLARGLKKSALLLDCYLDSGFLENYYKENGFLTIGTTTFRFPEREFQAALMECSVGL